MHILLIHQAFAALDEAGGTRHIEMARFLAERGHRVTIIASPVSYLSGAARGGRDEVSPGITVLRTYTYAALHRSFVHRVFAFLSFMSRLFFAGLRVGPVDLVWGTSPPIFQAVTAWLLARIKRAPYLLEVRDLWPAFAIAVGVLRNPLLIRLSQGLERFLYRRADRLVVNSPGFIRHVLTAGQPGSSSSRTGRIRKCSTPIAGARLSGRRTGWTGNSSCCTPAHTGSRTTWA